MNLPHTLEFYGEATGLFGGIAVYTVVLEDVRIFIWRSSATGVMFIDGYPDRPGADLKAMWMGDQKAQSQVQTEFIGGDTHGLDIFTMRAIVFDVVQRVNTSRGNPCTSNSRDPASIARSYDLRRSSVKGGPWRLPPT